MNEDMYNTYRVPLPLETKTIWYQLYNKRYTYYHHNKGFIFSFTNIDKYLIPYDIYVPLSTLCVKKIQTLESNLFSIKLSRTKV